MMFFAQVPLFPEQASTVAGEVDALYWFLIAVSAFFTALIAVLLMYFAIKYRRRSEFEVPRPIKGSLKLEIGWTVMPLIIGLIIFFWSARIFFAMYTPPENATTVYVVGKQWMWKLQHSDENGGVMEINELHVRLGEPIRLKMISEDVIHSFYIPAFRIKQDVLPGRYSSIWFEASKVGTYHLFCAEYCGTEHSRMIGRIVVMEPAEYDEWLRGVRQQGDPDSPTWLSTAAKGRQLFYKLGCIDCHGRQGTHSLAPLLENLHGATVRLEDGRTIEATDDYIRRSILDPKAEVVAGFKPIMFTYKGQLADDTVDPPLSEEDALVQLLAFIKSLGTGDTPPRGDRNDLLIEEATRQQEGNKEK